MGPISMVLLFLLIGGCGLAGLFLWLFMDSVDHAMPDDEDWWN